MTCFFKDLSGALRRRLPPPLKSAGRALLEAADPLVIARLRRAGTISGPVPPRRLRARVGEPGVVAFRESGRRVAEELERLLADAGRPLDTFEAIWDFGAGSGRVVTQLELTPDQKVAASDVDAEACRWLAANHPIAAEPSSSTPPAPFESNSFDLVMAVSVFTHLNEADQDLWLAEVGRVLRPGGLAMLSVMGPDLLAAYRQGRRPGMTSAQRNLLGSVPLEEAGIVFAEEPTEGRWDATRYPGTSASYGLTFHHESYVREHWSRYLNMIDIVPAALNWGQDAVLCGVRSG